MSTCQHYARDGFSKTQAPNFFLKLGMKNFPYSIPLVTLLATQLWSTRKKGVIKERTQQKTMAGATREQSKG